MAILDEQTVEFVRSIYPFNLLDDESFSLLLPELREIQFKSATSIYSFDDASSFYYLIASGRVEISGGKDREENRVTILNTGCGFGEEAFKAHSFRLTNAKCLENTHLVLINRDVLLRLAEANPVIRKAFSLLFLTLKHRLRLHLPWLGKGEKVRLISRRHPFFFFSRIVLINLVSISLTTLLISSVFSYRGFSIWLFLLGIIVFILGGLVSAWAALEWTNDYVFITTERVLVQKKLIGFFESRQEVPLNAILSTGMETSLPGRIIGYGAVNLRSYNGNLRFVKLPAPGLIIDLLEEERYRVEEERKEADQANMRQMLNQRIVNGREQQGSKTTFQKGMLTVSMYEGGSILDAIAKFIGLRIVKNGSVIYRTHWWILLKKTFSPGLILMAAVVFVLSKLGGLIPILSETTAFAMAIVVTISAFGWWLYQYIDWHNDIYIICPDQLMDVNRKPLGSEERRSAPLKNIQTVEFLQKGIIGLVLNFGTVRIQIGNEELTFDNVYDPAAIQTEIFAHFQAHNEILKRKEHEKLADYIQIYDEIRDHNDRKPANDKGDHTG